MALSSGGSKHVPEGWSFPNAVEGVSDGMVWVGRQPAKLADWLALREGLGEDVSVDRRSIVGLYDQSWSSYWNEKNPDAPKLGGEGSKAYELKLVGEAGNGVEFTREDIWYINVEGSLVKGIPPECGAYHRRYVGDGYYDLYEGPEPNSLAYELHKGGFYYWDDFRKLYDIARAFKKIE